LWQILSKRWIGKIGENKMRPLTLTITAFGPYATKEIIDFTELEGRNLFVITGDTGAGKTTIFDAIAYALYGKASGQDRDGESLRSHFAAPDLVTSVEIEFELRGERYWVRRIPKQRKKRVRGLGYIEQNAEAEFKKIEGQAEIISGVREVNEKIIGLLGLSYEQFKQIIMIPQGEFRELLTTDSKARQDILQKIFGTEGFRRVQEILDDQAKDMSQEVHNLQKQRDEYVRSLDGSSYLALAMALEPIHYNIALVMEEAKAAIAMDKCNGKDLQDQVTKQEEQIAEKQGEIFQSKANNLKISVRDEACQKKEMLLAGQVQIEEKKLAVKEAQKALGLVAVDENRRDRESYVQKKEVELLQAKAKTKNAQQGLEISQQKYQAEKEKEEEYNGLLTRQAKFQELRSTVADWDARQVRNVELEQELAIITKNREAIKSQLEKTRSEAIACQKELDKIRDKKAQDVLQAVELDKVNSTCTKLRILKKEQADFIRLEEMSKALKEQEAEGQTKYQQAKEEYQEGQKAFLQGQAGLIASQLKAGHSCPVCGSEHHPKLASLLEEIPTEGKLQVLGKKEEQARQRYDEVRGKFESCKGKCTAQRQIIIRLVADLEESVEDHISALEIEELSGYIGEKLPIWQEKKEQLTAKHEKIVEQEKEYEVLSELLGKKTELVTTLGNQLEGLETKYRELFAKVRSAQDAIKKLETEVPREMRSMKNLLEVLQGIGDEIQSMRESQERSQKEYRDSQVNWAATIAEEKSIEKSLVEGLEELKSAQQRFIDAMLAAGFKGEGAYRKAKLTEKEMRSLEEQINSYYAELRSLTDYCQQLQQEVEGLKLVDIPAMEEEHLALQLQKKELVKEQGVIVARQTHNERIVKNILLLLEKTAQKAEEHQVIGQLAKIAKGDNEEKISFERYVLAAFFNDIINAANTRLRKMTSGRYQMNRIAQKGKGGGQSGLEIEVLDYYTGQFRHVKTLSGGESFKASLALALGLAEVVQAYAGGISLDTMFVDEGFGTLDPESLDSAIACLMELQHSGRLVGIISHVPELKESIDARLEIKAGSAGSVAKFSIR